MFKFIEVMQIITAVLLIILILLQNKGAGIGEIFGNEGNVFRKKRGAEKTMFQITIIISILFFGSSIMRVLL